jgi:Uma2 family endonuclease
MASITVRPTYDDEPEDLGVRKHVWTRDEVYRAMAAGIFEREPKDWLKMELIDGELVEKMPQNRPHSVAVTKGQRILGRVFGATHYIGVQSPLQVNDISEPEPDLMVVRGDPDDYPDHPAGRDVALVMDISDSTVRQDRIVKPAIYARAGVVEYWVLLLKARLLEVRREPQLIAGTDVWEYRSVHIFHPTDTVAPIATRGAVIPVSELLPNPA